MLHERAYKAIAKKLSSQELTHGDQIHVAQLTASLRMSRSPVHHALQQLAAEGRVLVRSRTGYFVAPLSEDAINDAYDVRTPLEALASTSQGAALALSSLHQRLDALSACVRHNTEDSFGALDEAFHGELVRASANATVQRLSHLLAPHLIHYHAGRQLVVKHGEALVASHQRLLDAMEAGHGSNVEAAVRSSNDVERRLALEHFRSRLR